MGKRLTPEMMLDAAARKVADTVGLPGYDILSPFILPYLKDLFPGLNRNDAFWSAIITSSGTAYGDAMEARREAGLKAAKLAIGGQQNSAKEQFFIDLARTMVKDTPDFAQKHGGMSWEDYTAMKAQGMAGNPIINAMYAIADPGGYNQMGKNLATAYTNMVASRAVQGDRRAYAKASGVLGKLFTDKNGRFEYDPNSYGGFDAGATAYMVSELARGADFLDGVDVRSEDSLKNAAGRLRDKVKDISKALSPLKDIFGEDIPKMVESIEALTGMAIGNIDNTRLRSISEKLADRTAAGTYNASDVKVNEIQFSQMAMAMGIKTPSRLYMTEQAMAALDGTKGGTGINYMTNTEREQHVTRRIFGSYNSGQADALNKAFAIWQLDNPNKTVEDFKNEIRKKDPSGTNPLSAAMGLIGATTQAELDKGMYLSGYRQATEAGLGGQLAMDTNIAKTRRSHINAMAVSTAFKDAVGLNGKDTESVRSFLYDVVDQLKQTPDLANLTMDERRVVLMDRLGDAEKAEMYNRAIEGMRTVSPKMLADITLEADLEKQAKADARSSRMRKAVAAVTGDSASDFGQALTRYIKEGGSISKIVGDHKAAILAGMAAEDRDEFDAVITAIYGEEDSKINTKASQLGYDAATIRQLGEIAQTGKAPGEVTQSLSNLGVTSKDTAKRVLAGLKKTAGGFDSLAQEDRNALSALGYERDDEFTAAVNKVLAGEEDKLTVHEKVLLGRSDKDTDSGKLKKLAETVIASRGATRGNEEYLAVGFEDENKLAPIFKDIIDKKKLSEEQRSALDQAFASADESTKKLLSTAMSDTATDSARSSAVESLRERYTVSVRSRNMKIASDLSTTLSSSQEAITESKVEQWNKEVAASAISRSAAVRSNETRLAGDLVNWVLTDPAAMQNTTLGAAMEELLQAKKSADGSTDPDAAKRYEAAQRRFVTVANMVKNMNADVIDSFLKSGNDVSTSVTKESITSVRSSINEQISSTETAIRNSKDTKYMAVANNTEYMEALHTLASGKELSDGQKTVLTENKFSLTGKPEDKERAVKEYSERRSAVAVRAAPEVAERQLSTLKSKQARLGALEKLIEAGGNTATLTDEEKAILTENGYLTTTTSADTRKKAASELSALDSVAKDKNIAQVSKDVKLSQNESYTSALEKLSKTGNISALTEIQKKALEENGFKLDKFTSDETLKKSAIEEQKRISESVSTSREDTVTKSALEKYNLSQNEEYMTALKTLVSNDGDISKLSKEQQKILKVNGGYSDSAEDNLKRAKLDVLAERAALDGGVTGAVQKDLFLANTKNVIKNSRQFEDKGKAAVATDAMEQFRKWSDDNGRAMSAADFNEWMETIDKTTTTGSRIIEMREQLTSVFNQGSQAAGMNVKGESDAAGLMGSLIGVVRQLFDCVKEHFTNPQSVVAAGKTEG